MEKKVAVEILGNNACIESVTGRVADKLWWPADVIQVRLGFEKAVGGILSFCINLPVRDYTQDEFLKAVRVEGAYKLRVMLEGYRLRQDLRESREQKQRELDKIAWGIETRIGLG